MSHSATLDAYSDMFEKGYKKHNPVKKTYIWGFNRTCHTSCREILRRGPAEASLAACSSSLQAQPEACALPTGAERPCSQCSALGSSPSFPPEEPGMSGHK